MAICARTEYRTPSARLAQARSSPGDAGRVMRPHTPRRCPDRSRPVPRRSARRAGSAHRVRPSPAYGLLRTARTRGNSRRSPTSTHRTAQSPAARSAHLPNSQPPVRSNRPALITCDELRLTRHPIRSILRASRPPRVEGVGPTVPAGLSCFTRIQQLPPWHLPGHQLASHHPLPIPALIAHRIAP